MANPRKIRGSQGTGFRARPYQADNSTIVFDATKAGGSAAAGLAVGQLGDTTGTIRLVSDGEKVLGKLLKVEPDGMCAVQEEGGAVFLSSGTIVNGDAIVGALGPSNAKGYIRGVVEATAADVANGKHDVFDAATASAVQVILAK